MQLLTVAECQSWLMRECPKVHRALFQGANGPDFSARVPMDRFPAARSVPLAAAIAHWVSAGDTPKDELPARTLVWVREHGVWPSSEHLPLFNRWRASFGDDRALDTAPGQAVSGTDMDSVVSVIVLATTFGWGYLVGHSSGRAIDIDHDGKVEVWGEGGEFVTRFFENA